MYVISIKRIKDTSGNMLKEDEQYFEYFQFDNHSGSMSTGYPCFGFLCHAREFKSVDEAKEVFEKNAEALKLTEKQSNFDLSTLAIRKVAFHTKDKLQWD